MSEEAKVHSLRKLIFQFGGYTVDSGRADDGDVVVIEQTNDDYGYKQGPDGDGVFYELAPGATIVTLRMMQTAAANAVLSAMSSVAKAAGGLPAPLFVSNANGTGKLISASAVIAKKPDETWAQEPGAYEWRFIVHAPTRLVNSN